MRAASVSIQRMTWIAPKPAENPHLVTINYRRLESWSDGEGFLVAVEARAEDPPGLAEIDMSMVEGISLDAADGLFGELIARHSLK